MKRRAYRLGFSLIEAVMVLLIVAVVIGALTPSVIRQIAHARVNRAANVVAADFFLAQSLAGRQHGPVLVSFDSTNKQTTITQPPPANTNLLTRRFGIDSEFKLTTFTASATTVQILPNGMANAAVVMTVGSGGYNRQVRITRAGQIRVL